MAFLCVLGVNATPSGTGTKEDPYVIADGDTYVVGKNVTTYASFTAPEDGVLLLLMASFILHLLLKMVRS